MPILLATSPLAAIRSAPTMTASTSPLGEQRAGHRVGDDGVGDPEPTELPRGEPRTLEQRPSLVDPDVHVLVRLRCGPDHTQRGAVPNGGQRPGVAVRQHTRAVGDQRGTERRRARGSRQRQRPRCAAPPRAPPPRPQPSTRRGHARLPTKGSPRSAGPREASRRAAHPAAVETVDAASATPYAPAAPSAGAPRTASDRIAAMSSPTDAHSRKQSRSGNSRWSTSRTRPRRHSMVGGIGSRRSITIYVSMRRWASSMSHVDRSTASCRSPSGDCGNGASCAAGSARAVSITTLPPTVRDVERVPARAGLGGDVERGDRVVEAGDTEDEPLQTVRVPHHRLGRVETAPLGDLARPVAVEVPRGSSCAARRRRTRCRRRPAAILGRGSTSTGSATRPDSR